jgi:hypothetical protein
MGGETRTWATRGNLEDIPASIQRKGGNTVTQFSQRGVSISHAIYTSVDVSASVVGDRVTDGTNTYVVKYVEDMGAQGKAWVILVDLLPPS